MLVWHACYVRSPDARGQRRMPTKKCYSLRERGGEGIRGMRSLRVIQSISTLICNFLIFAATYVRETSVVTGGGWAHEIQKVWPLIVRAGSYCCCKTLPCPALQRESLGDSVVIIWSSQSCSGGVGGCSRQGCGARPGRGVSRTHQPLIRGVTRPG